MKLIIKITFFLILMTSIVSAVDYPIAELDNCSSQEECKIYCDNPENMEACIEFAEKEGMMNENEIEEAKKVLEYVKEGKMPGGCKGKRECEEYCNKEENLEECINFAVEAGLMNKKEAELIKKTKGKGPGGCEGKRECEEYCNKEENALECIEFSYNNGLISKEKYNMLKETAGKGPGDCLGDKECQKYCKEEENSLKCAEFAYKYGQISKEEYEMIKKTGGKGPGGCVGEEECEEYCSKEGNFLKCANFSYQNGEITEEEYQIMKLTKGKGPGGCTSDEECKEYCKNNEEECMDFALMTGLWKEDEGLTREQQCIAQCLIDKDLSYADCPIDNPESHAPGCMECRKECAKYYEGPCLDSWEIDEQKQECKSKGEKFGVEPVMGDSGDGAECIIDIECIDYRTDLEKKTPEEIMEEGGMPPEGDLDKKIGDKPASDQGDIEEKMEKIEEPTGIEDKTEEGELPEDTFEKEEPPESYDKEEDGTEEEIDDNTEEVSEEVS